MDSILAAKRVGDEAAVKELSDEEPEDPRTLTAKNVSEGAPAGQFSVSPTVVTVLPQAHFSAAAVGKRKWRWML